MSAPLRRKAKKRAITFTLVVEAQAMIVKYMPDWMVDYGQFEFRSPHKPARRIPVSETGYRSHFAPMEDVEASASPQDYARDFVLHHLRSRHQTRNEDRDQLPLFWSANTPAGRNRQGFFSRIRARNPSGPAWSGCSGD